MILASVALKAIVHVSVQTGNMGYMVYFYAIPILALAIPVWAVATRRLSNPTLRRVSLVAAILLAAVPFTLIRTAGVSGTGAELHWRWTPTPEERLLAEAKEEPLAVAAPPAAAPPAAAPTETAKEPLSSDRSEPSAAKPAAKPVAVEKPTSVPAAPVTAKAEPPAFPATATPAEWPGFRGP